MTVTPSTLDATPEALALWSSLLMKTVQMTTASAQVVALRTSRMVAAGVCPGESDQREMSLMGSEKVDAFTRSGTEIALGMSPLVFGMASQWFRAGMAVFDASVDLAGSRTLPQTWDRQGHLARTLLRHAPRAQPGASASARLAHRALEPVHAAATANARRLTRRA